MICPWKEIRPDGSVWECGHEWSGEPGTYLDQTFHYGLTFREVGHRCPKCGRTFVVVMHCEARPWHKRPARPPDRTIDMFEDTPDA